MRNIKLLAALLSLVWLASVTPVGAATRFIVSGATVCSTHDWTANCFCTVTGTGTTCGGSTGLPTAADTLTCDANSGTGTFTVNNAPAAFAELIFTACSLTIFDGSTAATPLTLNGANVDVLCSGASSTSIKMGANTWQLQSTNNSQNAMNWTSGCATWGDLTGTLLLNGAATTGQRTFAGGGIGFPNVQFGGGGPFQITGNNTFTSLGCVAGQTRIAIASAATETISSLTASGLSASSPCYLGVNGFNTSATLSISGSPTVSWFAVQGLTISGAGSIIFNNSFNLGGNTLGTSTINGPSGGGGGYVF